MKTGAGRIWIEDFRIPRTTEGRIVSSMMQQWKAVRQRPTHFVAAIMIYKALIEGDLNYFMELLIQYAPRTALKLVQQQQSDAPRERGEIAAKSGEFEALPIERVEQSAEQKIDVLAGSLGIDVSFD